MQRISRVADVVAGEEEEEEEEEEDAINGDCIPPCIRAFCAIAIVDGGKLGVCGGGMKP